MRASRAISLPTLGASAQEATDAPASSGEDRPTASDDACSRSLAPLARDGLQLGPNLSSAARSVTGVTPRRSPWHAGPCAGDGEGCLRSVRLAALAGPDEVCTSLSPGLRSSAGIRDVAREPDNHGAATAVIDATREQSYVDCCRGFLA